MLLNAEQFETYLNSAFKHFCSGEGLNQPFDFVKASLLHCPISFDFSNNISTLGTILLKKRHTKADPAGEDLLKSYFDVLSKPVSSAIMFDIIRNRRTGNAEAIYKGYSDFVKTAISGILASQWPCAHKGCVNKAIGHAKGHQDENGKVDKKSKPIIVGDTIILPGTDYRAALELDFDAAERDFEKKIKNHLIDNLGRIQRNHDESAQEIKVARNMHVALMRTFYHDFGGDHGSSDFLDSVGCMCCLVGIANHSLQCGHIICDDCAMTFGKQLSDTLIESCCPFHTSEAWYSPTLISKIPDLAGYRIMSLDGSVQSIPLYIIEHY